MAVSEARRQQNREAQARLREKAKKQPPKPLANPDPKPLAPSVAMSAEVSAPSPRAAIPTREFVRAGQIAGHLEMSFRLGVAVAPIPNEPGARYWLDTHPFGASVVLELLAVSGLAPSFTLWRGDR